MKLLLLSAQSEEAHKRTLFSIKAEAAARGHGCDMLDPSVFSSNPGTMHSHDSEIVRGLAGAINASGADIVLCTDQFTMETVSAARARVKPPCCALLTDYACTPRAARPGFDIYFIPHPDLTERFVEAGVPRDRIAVTGVPISRRFDSRMSREAARNYLVIPPRRRVYLLLFGGMNRNIIEGICDEFLREESGDFTAYLPVRRNSDLRDDLKEKYRLDPHIHVIAYTEKQNILMDAADVILTRPFGTQSTETSAAGVPMVHVMILPGRERLTAEFFSDRGCAVTAEGVRDAIRKARELATDQKAARAMVEAQKRVVLTRGAETLMDHIERLK